jgi:hypothetical protein
MIVREYFELHGFFVCQQRKYVTPVPRDEGEADFWVLNPLAREVGGARPFILSSADLVGIREAIVAVKGWHTEVFSVTYLSNTPEVFRFLEPAAMQQAARGFGPGASPARLLVVPKLPQTADLRDQSIEFLRQKGVDGVILFSTMLSDLIAQTEESRNYQKSDLLQAVRLLKNYGFFKEAQMELFQMGRRKVGGRKARPGPPEGQATDAAPAAPTQ